MRIAIFVTYLPPHIGGIETVAQNQIDALAAAGHELNVVTSACGAMPGISKDKKTTIYRLRAWNYFEERMSAVFPVFSPALFFRAMQIVRQSDVVHAHDAFYLTSLAAAFWCRILRKPLVVTQHVDIVPHPSPIVMMVQRIVYATTGKFILSTAQRVIMLNSRVRRFLIDRGIAPDRIVFLPNGIDTDKFSPTTKPIKTRLRSQFGLPNDKVIALFVGRFVPKKGYDKLLELPPIDGLQMVFAGGDETQSSSRNDRIFLGKVATTTIPDLYRTADIFILPSTGEGFPMTIQEAMSTGLAVVTTDDPSYELYDLSPREICLIEPAEDIINSILQSIVRNTKKVTTLSRNARTFAVEHFSLTFHAHQLQKLYQEVLR